jgi:glutamate-5-semialdehyde dehydrogenase
MGQTAQKMDVNKEVLAIAERAKRAANALALAPEAAKNKALTEAAKALREHSADILKANQKDAELAKQNGISAAMLDRLLLDQKRIESMAKGLEDIAALPDPVGKVLSSAKRPNGLTISRVSVPIGVIAVIYESRPNVTADAGALCLKSGNTVILRGGSESFHSSQAILRCLQQGVKAAGLPEDAIQSIPTTDREAVGALLKLDKYIDIIVPRGGKGLIRRIMEETRIPVVKHLDGICHTYIHADAKPDMAREITLNAKMRRTGVCGSTETLLIDRAIAKTMLPNIAEALVKAGCELRGDAEARAIFPMKEATAEDWDTEYLDAILSVKVVNGVEEAIAHINTHGSQHTDAIITESTKAAEQFLNGVESAIAVHNASTQFADGGEFGMGAEIGISTGKLHARGPVGVEQLTTYKYKVEGNGQIRPN